MGSVRDGEELVALRLTQPRPQGLNNQHCLIRCSCVPAKSWLTVTPAMNLSLADRRQKPLQHLRDLIPIGLTEIGASAIDATGVDEWVCSTVAVKQPSRPCQVRDRLHDLQIRYPRRRVHSLSETRRVLSASLSIN